MGIQNQFDIVRHVYRETDLQRVQVHPEQLQMACEQFPEDAAHRRNANAPATELEAIVQQLAANTQRGFDELQLLLARSAETASPRSISSNICVFPNGPRRS